MLLWVGWAHIFRRWIFRSLHNTLLFLLIWLGSEEFGNLKYNLVIALYMELTSSFFPVGIPNCWKYLANFPKSSKGLVTILV